MGVSVVIGVDGGGTKTHAVVLDAGGAQLGQAFAPSSNANSVGEETARVNILKSMEDALSNAVAGADLQVRAVCLALAGVDRPEDVTRVREWLGSVYPPPIALDVYNDAMGALASGTNGCLGSSCVLIAGTGTIALGVKADGQAVARAADGRGLPTALTSAILSHLEIQKPEQLIAWAYGTSGWAHIASLAPVVCTCAQNGDATANAIIEEGVQHLCESVATVTAHLQPPEGPAAAVPLVLTGGLLGEGSVVTEKLKHRLNEMCPSMSPVHPKMDPAAGAAMLALARLSST